MGLFNQFLIIHILVSFTKNALLSTKKCIIPPHRSKHCVISNYLIQSIWLRSSNSIMGDDDKEQMSGSTYYNHFRSALAISDDISTLNVLLSLTPSSKCAIYINLHARQQLVNGKVPGYCNTIFPNRNSIVKNRSIFKNNCRDICR